MLQVHQVEIPAEVGIEVVHRHARIFIEAVIVLTDRNFHAMGQQRPRWMRSHVVNIPEKLVRDGASFDANVLLLDLINEVWMHGKPKAVSDSL